MIPVNKRGGFSDRNGIKPLNTEIQLKDFDEHTRVKIFNSILYLYENFYGGYEWNGEIKQEFCRYILQEVYSRPLELEKKYYDDDIFGIIKDTIMNDEYHNVLTVLEAIVNYLFKNFIYSHYRSERLKIYDYLNSVFQQEYVGYRFIEGLISPISDEIEVEAVSEALDNKFKSVHEHIFKANAFLSDKEKPDYENSIKESISAVEAMCQEILGTKGGGATLGKMLKKLEDNGIEIHSALKDAFNKLYGYTSDANGIRHAGDIGGSSSTFEEAKFMLVSCSAFINYLMGLQSKIKC